AKMSSLLELVRRLHEERLFIKSEQDTIWKLNEEVRQNSETLSHTFWITRQHYLNLSRLIVNSTQDTPALCNRRSKQLDNIEFVDGYKELGYQESMYGQFVEAFINNPTFAAACLAYGDKLGLDSTADVARTMVTGCYGSNIIRDDHKQLLELLETLMLLQLATIEQPSRMLQKGTSAFCTVFRLFAESLSSGKLFLMSALHEPIMEILMDHELFLETNPQKVLARLSQHEIMKRFGKEENPSFKEKLKQHVDRTEQALMDICSTFVDSLLRTMNCFPQSLGWVISRAFHIVKDSGLISESEARSLSADFLLHQFVCPAVNPELYGVIEDVPLSDLTRFNLMQIAQVLQVMAHWNKSSQQNDSFYSKLDKGPMQRLIDTVISLSHPDTTPDNMAAQQSYVNRSIFITTQQLVQIIRFLTDLQKSDVRGVDQTTLANILSQLPDNPPASIIKEMLHQNSTQHLEDDGKQLFRENSSTISHRNKHGHSHRNKQQDFNINTNPTISSPTVGTSQTAPKWVLVIQLSNSSASEQLPGTLSESEDGISRTSGSSSIDLDQQGEVPADDTSSIHAVSSHGNQVTKNKIMTFFSGVGASVTHANNDEALKALRRKLPTSRESIEDKMRKFEIRQELGVLDARSETWSMDVYASDSEAPTEQDSQSERLNEIAEGPPDRLRASNNGSISSFLALARDEDSRSDVWSVEVLPSDSEPPDIRSEDRLQELESETGTAASEDVMEDNRSRASTPGLSAASGFSGVSGLSLVSDNIQAKASDEQWAHYDRGFGKGPNSISPDADDLIHRGGGSGGSSHIGCGGSSNSSEQDRPLPNSSSASPRLQTNQSPLLLGSNPNIRTSASFDAKRGVEKSVAWNIPKQDESPDEASASPTDFEHINTIKRSPYKKVTKDGREMKPPHTPPPKTQLSEPNPQSAPQNVTPAFTEQRTAYQQSKIVAWDEVPDKPPPEQPQGVNHNPDSPFVVVNTQQMNDAVLLAGEFPSLTGALKRQASIQHRVSEDILQKYRQKVSDQQSESPLSDDTVTTAARGASSTSSYHGEWRGSHDPKSRAVPASCPMEKMESKEDTKRKLRKALSMAEPPPEPPSPAMLLLGSTNSSIQKNSKTQRHQLLSFLRISHAEALMLHDRSRIAHLDEVLRSISQLDDAACRSLLQSMWNDCKQRSSYTGYLTRARQHLLSTSAYLQHMYNCAERDKRICRKYFTSQYVRILLKEREKVVSDFRNNFMRLGASDEKITLVESFLSWINSRIREDSVWEGASEEQVEEAEKCVERTIFTSIAKHAMFPNGDADILRDQLFHQHITRLSAVLTPLHPSLQVRRKYLKESPWCSAQREARMLSAHRSPRGKLDAALRCCRAVMHLLKLADESEAPGADDFTPVLVFVLIKANPVHLLSTVQYVTSFVGNQLTGEESYWWMQFTAATEFIKTIDERK
uniref:VPS9 domain-containing protein n=1 Tax=Ciona savignyi TaxID=51511 RepID=H2ZEQ6_CIOSA